MGRGFFERLHETYHGRGSSLMESRPYAMFVSNLGSVSVSRPMIERKSAAADMADVFRLLDLLVRAVLPQALKANRISMPWFRAHDPIMYVGDVSASVFELNRIVSRLGTLTEKIDALDEGAEMDALRSLSEFIYMAIEESIIPAIRVLKDGEEATVRGFILDAVISLSGAVDAAVDAGASSSLVTKYVKAVLNNEPLFVDEII
jgi:hypothetical protein